jgi:hypothetical protein
LYEKELKVIQDYKVTSVWSVIYGKKEWEEQLNIYCWLLRKKGYEVEALRIIAILKDWTASKLKDSDNYPRIPIAVVNIPLWTLEEQDKYVNERIRVHKEAEKLPDDKIPICSKEERWAKDDSYAIYKVGSLGKALRVFNNEAEAREFKDLMVDQNETLKLTIKLRRGESRRCTGYCSVAHLCNYGKTLIKEGM